jgi:hypothetical protein
MPLAVSASARYLSTPTIATNTVIAAATCYVGILGYPRWALTSQSFIIHRELTRPMTGQVAPYTATVKYAAYQADRLLTDTGKYWMQLE